MTLPTGQLVLFSTAIVVFLVVWFGTSGQKGKAEFGRIVNGEEAEAGGRTYQASVQLNFGSRLESTKRTHFCGGAFVAKNWVLTAAHCVRNQNSRQLKIVGGTNDITDKNTPTYQVKKIIMNMYNDITKHNDLALLNIDFPLDQPNDKNHLIEPVSLCREDFQPVGENCTVSGWGHLKSKGSSVPDKLREVSVTVLNGTQCQKMLQGYPWDPHTNTMLCAGGEDKDACQGDSGGPLVCQDGGEICLAGVVSWGVGCATEGIPGVYTNVRRYNQWIQDHMTGNGSDKDVGNSRQGLFGLFLDVMEAIQTKN